MLFVGRGSKTMIVRIKYIIIIIKKMTEYSSIISIFFILSVFSHHPIWLLNVLLLLLHPKVEPGGQCDFQKTLCNYSLCKQLAWKWAKETKMPKKVYFHKMENTVKFQKLAPGLIFLKALFEGLIFGRAYIRREIWVSKSIGLAS